MYIKNCSFHFQLSNGEIWVKFDDGTQVGVKPTTTTVKYVDLQGKLFRYAIWHFFSSSNNHIIFN